MDRLAELTATFLQAQVAAGVDAVQLFDSWAGALSERDYRAVRAAALGAGCWAGWPTPACRGSTSEWAPASCSARWPRPAPTWSASTGGCRWTWPPGGPAATAPVQGNLDPAVLFADPDVDRGRGAADRRARAARAPGHVFNLGHGVLPETDPDVLTRLVELVHGLYP